MQPTSNPEEPTAAKRPRGKNAFFLMVGMSVVASLGLVVVAMYLYNMSGAAQLDLSLPGLQEERIRAQQSKRYDDFAPTGKLDSSTLKQFDELYKHQQTDIKHDTGGFDTKPLDDDQLGISVQ